MAMLLKGADAARALTEQLHEQAEELMPGVEGIVVLDKTPFYAEMGGQVGDHGVLTAPNGGVFQVTDVQKNKGGKYMHYGKMSGGVLKLGDTVKAEIDVPRRKAIMRAHSATHLLDYALRTVLGDHAHQAGSLVEPDRLRYDFTHFSAVTADELVKISRLVSELVLDGMPVETKEMPTAEAKKLEAHKLYYDVQCVASGIERVEVAPLEGLVCAKEYDEADDYALFESPMPATLVVLHAGEIAVLPPEDAHKPGCIAEDAPVHVKKVVVKVRA